MPASKTTKRNDLDLQARIGGAHLPSGPLTREDRVRLAAEVFNALVEGRMPSRAAALFLGGGGLAWLERGGDLVRDYLKLAGRPGSHRTPSMIFQRTRKK